MTSSRVAKEKDVAAVVATARVRVGVRVTVALIRVRVTMALLYSGMRSEIDPSSYYQDLDSESEKQRGFGRM